MGMSTTATVIFGWKITPEFMKPFVDNWVDYEINLEAINDLPDGLDLTFFDYGGDPYYGHDAASIDAEGWDGEDGGIQRYEEGGVQEFSPVPPTRVLEFAKKYGITEPPKWMLIVITH